MEMDRVGQEEEVLGFQDAEEDPDLEDKVISDAEMESEDSEFEVIDFSRFGATPLESRI